MRTLKVLTATLACAFILGLGVQLLSPSPVTAGGVDPCDWTCSITGCGTVGYCSIESGLTPINTCYMPMNHPTGCPGPWTCGCTFIGCGPCDL